MLSQKDLQMFVLNIFRFFIDKVMSFCISRSEYLLDPDLYDIVSGPSESCLGCSPKPFSMSPLNFFEWTPQAPGMMSLSSDKIFFAASDGSAVPNVCGKEGHYIVARVFSGSKSYNSPWSFHIDPDSVSVVAQENPPNANSNLSPSLINSLLASGGLAEGAELCFGSSTARKMEVTGLLSCGAGLSFEPSNIQDPTTGLYIQKCQCTGECEGKVNDGVLAYCPGDLAADAIAKFESDYAAFSARVEMESNAMTDSEIGLKFILYSMDETEAAEYQDWQNTDAAYQAEMRRI
jgi:hypothetical protein